MSDSSAFNSGPGQVEKAAGERWRCTECGHIAFDHEIDAVKDPGGDDTWRVCKACRTPENFERLCDDVSCLKAATCGMPTPTHYAWTCHWHLPTPAVSPDKGQG